MKDNISSLFTSTKQDMNTIYSSIYEILTNQFVDSKENIDSHFSETNENITNQYTELTTIVNANDDNLYGYLENIFGSISNKLDSVFTFVSDGKRLLASALLTKGVDCAEDATFQEICDAILSISQELVIGVEQIPGEIEYEYHYHINGTGTELHAGTCSVGQMGAVIQSRYIIRIQETHQAEAAVIRCLIQEHVKCQSHLNFVHFSH